MTTSAAHAANTGCQQLLPVGKIARVLRELPNTIQLAHLTEYGLGHLEIALDARADVFLIRPQCCAAAVE
jgi:hypothetical protein